MAATCWTRERPGARHRRCRRAEPDCGRRGILPALHRRGGPRAARGTTMTTDHPNLTVVDHPLIQHKLTLMRDRGCSTSSFRRLMREVAMLLAYEISDDLPLTTRPIETPLAEIDAPVLAGKKPALISILRAGNGLLDGVLELIPSARVGYVGLYRDETTHQPVQYYFKVPTELAERRVIVLDPMLATGNSSAAAVSLLKQAGATDIRFLCLLAAPEGVRRMAEAHPDVPVHTAALDRRLNENAYIVPGLGDAGDRLFGTK
jgi:uracil phosphoribosyltransferase